MSAAASAAPVGCTTAPGGAPETSAEGQSQCDSVADGSSAAAGYGFEGWGSAAALEQAAALALGLNGGTAVSDATAGAGTCGVVTDERVMSGLSTECCGSPHAGAEVQW